MDPWTQSEGGEEAEDELGDSGSSVRILQAGIPKWVAIPLSGDLPKQGWNQGSPGLPSQATREEPINIPTLS